MKILILGDVSPRETTDGLFKVGDVDTLFSDTRELFCGKDLCFVNLECALTESTGAIKKFGPNLKGCTETSGVLARLGVTVCGLSNNHIFDYGAQGYRDTVAALEAAGLAYTGFGENYENARKNYIFEKDGEKMVAYMDAKTEGLGSAVSHYSVAEYLTTSDKYVENRKLLTSLDKIGRAHV